MSRIAPHPVLSVALFASWLALTGQFSIAHAALAALLAIVLPLACGRFLDAAPRVHSARAVARFMLLVTWDIVVANVTVARLVLGPPGRLKPAFVKVPLELSDGRSIAILASVITMTPGTVSVDLTADRRTLLVHALDCSDPDALAVAIKRRYERPLMEIFGC